MRATLLTTTAILGLLAAPMFAHIAVAQTATAPFARPGNVIGSGDSLPLGSNASNISGSDTHSTIAPRLPTPDVGPDASPQQLLRAARQALTANKTGAAQQALEMAETRTLDRSVPPALANDPSHRPLVKVITDARDALAAGDKAGAIQMIDTALRG
jgi:hypothetical protein